MLRRPARLASRSRGRNVLLQRDWYCHLIGGVENTSAKRSSFHMTMKANVALTPIPGPATGKTTRHNTEQAAPVHHRRLFDVNRHLGHVAHEDYR